MSKQISKELKQYLDDVKKISALKSKKKFESLRVSELPFDMEMLSHYELYRASRKHFFALGGKFVKSVVSTLRSLSADDIFNNEISYTPAETEIKWFASNYRFVPDAEAEVLALQRFNDISIFHEQNHRVVWALLPAPPLDRGEFRRYLNFAESLVVTLDAALGDQVDPSLSQSLFRHNLLYRPSEQLKKISIGGPEYRPYLLSFFAATYMLLERVHKADIPKAVHYLFPGQKALNLQAVKRGLELNEAFTEVTNPEWQALHWEKALKNLQNLNKKRKAPVLKLPLDPLDLHGEFALVSEVLDYFDQSHPLSPRRKSGRKDKQIKAK